jgi:2-dehydropantoate 2-reductase
VTLTDTWTQHVEALQANGLDTDGVRGLQHFEVKACLSTDLKEPLDMLFLGTKSQHTVEAMDSVKHLLTPESTIVSLQNGFNVETLQAYVPPSQIVGTVPNYGGALVSPGHIEFVHEGPLHIGELSGEITPRIRWLETAFENLTDTHVSTNILGEVWGKQCYFSQITLTALVDAPVHRVLGEPRWRSLGILLVAEALDVADAEGVEIPVSASFEPAMYRPQTAQDVQRTHDYWEQYLDVLSRHQDRDEHQYAKTASGVWWDIVYRQRPSETRNGLTGAVVDKAHLHDVPVPLNDRLVEMIYEIEDGERTLDWQNLEELDAYRQKLGLELP